MKDADEQREEGSNDYLRSADDAQPASALALDTDRYLPELEEFDITEDQKIEMLQTLWSLMRAFVDIGWGVDSIHHVLPDLAAITSESDADEIDSEDAGLVDRFDKAAERKAAPRDERT